MEFYDNRYYHIQKKLLICNGLWPYHSKRKLISSLWLTASIIVTVPQIIGIKVNLHDMDKLMEHVLACIVQFTMFMKLFTLVIAEDKMKLLYHDMLDNWMMITDSEEKNILIQYAEKARMVTIGFLGISVVIYLGFISLPAIPMILDTMNPSSEPVAKIYILHGEFLVATKDDYYAIIYLMDVLAVTCVIAVVVPIDMMYATTVAHCLGLFSITRFRLLKLKYLTGTQDAAYDHLVGIIKLYQRILRFTETLEEMYSICFLVVVTLHIVVIPLVSCMILINFDETINLCRYVMFFSAISIHLFNIFWPGQLLIDHSESLFLATYDNEWYGTSLKTKKILAFLMFRCSKPSFLSGKGVIELNFANYFMIMKTAASYITVAASFR